MSSCLYVPMWQKKLGGCLYKLTCCNTKSHLLFKYKLYLWINFIYHSKALDLNFLSYSHWQYGCKYVSFRYVPLQMLNTVPCCDALTCKLVNTKKLVNIMWKQESISVGCVAPAYKPYPVVSMFGGIPPPLDILTSQSHLWEKGWVLTRPWRPGSICFIPSSYFERRQTLGEICVVFRKTTEYFPHKICSRQNVM